jgi:voltage-gated potassium channel
MTDGMRVDRWDRHAEWPLAAAAVAFLVAYAVPILRPELSDGWKSFCGVVVLGTWVLFAVDYVARVALAERRWTYWWHHLVDLAIVALPVLRPLRLLRLLMLLRALNRRASSSLRGRIAIYVVSATALLLFCASLAVLDAERGHPDASIRNFPDALWWSVTTITTVGYGDQIPLTGEGRLVAVGLMLGGIALLGIVTAWIASWVIERVQETEETAQAATRSDLQALQAEVRELRRLIETRIGEPQTGA